MVNRVLVYDVELQHVETNKYYYPTSLDESRTSYALCLEAPTEAPQPKPSAMAVQGLSSYGRPDGCPHRYVRIAS